MIFNMGRPTLAKGLPEFTFTGKSNFKDLGNGHWYLALLTSGILTFTKTNGAKRARGFACGPGANGEAGRQRTDADPGQGGKGGNGGEIILLNGIAFKVNVPYAVTLDNPGGTTRIEENGVLLTDYYGVACNAHTGGGKVGGFGVGSGTAGIGQDGTRPFGGLLEYRYGASGGGGSTDQGLPNVGGKDGAGNGGKDSVGTNAQANSGSGGGGGGAGWYRASEGGKGAIGIIILADTP